MALKHAQTVVDFYILCTKLKNIIRSGWKRWNVQRERLESVAEHIFGVQSLAIAMWSQYRYDVDIYKVIMMVAVHELEEIIIGDYTPFDISRDEKLIKGHDAVKTILKNLLQKDEIEKLTLEFSSRKTKEAKFAHHCDKLECDIQSKLYDAEGCVDLTKQDNNPIFQDKYVQELLKKKNGSWSAMWLEYRRSKYGYDKNFKEVSNYVEQLNLSAKIRGSR